MAYVITQKCVGTCDTGCVDVCPCDCIIGIAPTGELRAMSPADRGQMYIDPDPCIDCGACLQECPADAIRYETDAPEAAAINAAFARAASSNRR
jgi:NAD-dependent dihydropyrimidine dehydrogenase PreA subunit